MSTRSAICRMTRDGPICSYHHWDGYPEGLGATLFHVAHGVFGGDVEAMLKTLVDEHASWSTINGADWNQPIGFGSSGPQCYCHGERHEDVRPMTLAEAPGAGCEWAYVIYPEQRLMKVLSSYTGGTKMIGMFGMGDPNAEWRVVAEVALDGPEPDWNAVQSGGEE